MAAVTERKAWEAAGVTRLREANTGKNAGIANRAAAEAARDTLTATPAAAADTTAGKKEAAKTGKGSPIGGMATADMIMEADTGVAMEDTAADMLPDMAAAPELLVAGEDVAAAVADVAAATKRPSPTCPPNRMRDCVIF